MQNVTPCTVQFTNGWEAVCSEQAMDASENYYCLSHYPFLTMRKCIYAYICINIYNVVHLSLS
jgi:hypothetical protein